MQVHLESTFTKHQLCRIVEKRDWQSWSLSSVKSAMGQTAFHRPKCFPFDADNNKLRVESLRFLTRANWQQL